MAYTSIIPVHRLDRSIAYIKDEKKTTKRETAGSLEEAISYALNREKTEYTVFEDAIGCTCASAFEDMVATKKRFHKMDGVQGYHLIQSFAKGEVTPELAHLIGQELAEGLLKGRFEAVVTTHLNTSHYHNHIVFNSVSMEDGRKYHSNAKSYYEEVRKISDAICIKYGLSVIPENRGNGKHYAQWQAERDGKPTWRTAIRMDIREAVQESYTWKQFLAQMEQRGYVWKWNQKYPSLKAPGMERFVRLKSLGKNYTEEAIQEWILKPKRKNRFFPQEADRASGAVLFLSLSDGGTEKASSESFLSGTGGYPPFRQKDCPDGVPAKARDYNKGADCSVPCGQRNRNGIPLKRAQEVVPGTAGFTKDQRDHGAA